MKIAFIAPYKELAQLVEQVAKEIEIKIDIFLGVFKEGANISKDLEKQGYDVLISRGATYLDIVSSVHLPVVNCDTTVFDILYALYEAVKYSKEIGLILPNNNALKINILAETFGIKLLYMTSYKNIQEVNVMVEKAIEKGAEVIIGGVSAKEYADNLGKKGILLKTSPETIKQSISNAIEIANLSRKQMIQAERLNQILSFSYEGIIVTDSNGIVTVFNSAAEKIMGIKAKNIIGNRADKYITTTKLIDVLKNGEPQLSEIQKVNNSTIITNRIPIKIKETVQGAIATFQDISKIQDYEMKIRSEIYKKGLIAKYTFDNYIGDSTSVRMLISKAKIYATSDSTVLISGESGTGKEILAQAIHNASTRKEYPFVAVNCSAIPGNLLESELFGYDAGAFTGAKKDGKMGLFELAHKGTIFLDEIGSMPMNLQSSLLRVLQEKEVWRLGSNRVVKIDVRVIAATNNNLFEAVERENFRRDLYYRLNVLKLNTVPLRDRKEDIDILLDYFIRIYCKEPIKINDTVKINLKNYFWPGNVRELENFIERVSLIHDKFTVEEIFREFIEDSKKDTLKSPVDENCLAIKKGTLKEMEEEIIQKLYKEYNRNSTLLSEKLCISRTTLWKKLKNV